MGNGTKGRSGPAAAPLNHHRARNALDRELLELEKRKLVEIRRGTVALTLAGYREILRRAKRGES
jgi:hypothetical protein